jgi:nucleotide-binding universal stress UspA family protein
VSFYLRVPADLRDDHRGHLARAARRLRRRFPALTIREDLYEGRPSNGLSALAASAELVVIGSHRRGAIAGLLVGSVGRDLLHHCATPLCVVPSRREVPAPARAQLDAAHI